MGNTFGRVLSLMINEAARSLQRYRARFASGFVDGRAARDAVRGT
jgi:hypothetical protein